MSIPLSATDALRRAREGILAPAGLDEGRIEQALGGPLPLNDWRPLIQRVIRRCITGDDMRILPREVSFA